MTVQGEVRVPISSAPQHSHPETFISRYANSVLTSYRIGANSMSLQATTASRNEDQ